MAAKERDGESNEWKSQSKRPVIKFCVFCILFSMNKKHTNFIYAIIKSRPKQFECPDYSQIGKKKIGQRKARKSQIFLSV